MPALAVRLGEYGLNITFLGAAREVTGSCYRIEANGASFLVDYELFQGGMGAYRKNRARPSFDPREIDFVLLSHAHIDHSGLLPRLVDLGFRGPIYATPATCDLLEVMLPDAAYVQEREAARRRGRRGAKPLYTGKDAQRALRQLKRVHYGETLELRPGVRFRFQDAGHILGSAIVELWLTEGQAARKVVFSGDIGQKGRPIVNDPALIPEADVVVVESTYGNRLHRSMKETEAELVELFGSTLESGRGNIVVPAFAVGRTQELLHVIADLQRSGRIRPGLAIYVDSPMATRATAVTVRNSSILDKETRALLEWERSAGGEGLNVHFTESVEESMRLNTVRDGAVIISASGMCDAGRVKYHLRHNLPRSECSILFTGFQAEGTLGRRIVEGAKVARIFGEDVPVRARIWTVGGLSAHADRDGLLDWLGGFRRPPSQAFVVHGESATANGFAEHVRERLGWNALAPGPGETHPLSGAA